MSPQQLSPSRKVLSVLWALMPLYTLGLLAPAPFVHAAFRFHRLRMWLIAAGYGAVWLAGWILIPGGSDGSDSVASNIGAVLILALIVVGTIHALQLRRPVFEGMARKRRNQPPTYAAAPTRPEPRPIPMPEDVGYTCSRLRGELDRMTGYIRTHPGAFPPDCERLIGETADYARRVVDSAARDRRVGHELVSVREILTEYLPVAMNAYTRLPSDFALTQVNPQGKTPAQELELQLTLMRDAAHEAVESLARGDSRRLREQSAFLRSKFHRSELDL